MVKRLLAPMMLPMLAPDPTEPGKRPRVKQPRAPRPKQVAFVAAYTNPESDTYANQTASYKAAYGVTDDHVAAVKASALVRRGDIRLEITEILRQQGLETKDRVQLLNSIARGTISRTTKQTVTDGAGAVKQVLETESPPTHSERIQALHVINKLSGDYEKPKLAGDLIRSEYKELARRLRRELDPKQVSQAQRDAAIEEGPQDTQ